MSRPTWDEARAQAKENGAEEHGPSWKRTGLLNNPHYVEGRTAKKYNLHWYNLNRPAKSDGHMILSPGFKRWLKNLMKNAPPPTRASYILWGPDANDTSIELQKMGVPPDMIEFPECEDCGENVKINERGVCDDCEADRFETFAIEWLAENPQEIGDLIFPDWDEAKHSYRHFREIRRIVREAYRESVNEEIPNDIAA